MSIEEFSKMRDENYKDIVWMASLKKLYQIELMKDGRTILKAARYGYQCFSLII
jgi:hypothetical protein